MDEIKEPKIHLPKFIDVVLSWIKKVLVCPRYVAVLSQVSGVKGSLLADDQGLCLAGKGKMPNANSGVLAAIAGQANLLEPGSLKPPIIILESDNRYQVPGVKGCLLADDQGLCIAVKGNMPIANSGVMAALAGQANLLEPSSLKPPIIILETDSRQLSIIQFRKPTAVLNKNPST